MKNVTYIHEWRTPSDRQNIRSNKHFMPQDYSAYKMYPKKEDIKTSTLNSLQAQLLHAILVKWWIHPEAVNAIEEIQTEKELRMNAYDTTLLSIPLCQIVDYNDIDSLTQELIEIGAGDTIFERYAWLWRRHSRSASQLSTFFSTQNCSI